jgi:hypothetical protein
MEILFEQDFLQQILLVDGEAAAPSGNFRFTISDFERVENYSRVDVNLLTGLRNT